MNVIPRLALAVCFTWCVAAAAPAAERAIFAGGKAELSLQLDRDTWRADEKIAGYIQFRLTQVKDGNDVEYDAVMMNGPQISIVFDDRMRVVPTGLQSRAPLRPPLKVGHQYRQRFVIDADAAFRKLLSKPDRRLLLFNPGRYKLRVQVDSPPRPTWAPPPKTPWRELAQRFTSPPVEVAISAAPDADALTTTQLKRAKDAATGQLKERIIHFYARRGVLKRQDVLADVNAATGPAKARLAEFYLQMDWPVEDLAFFAPAGQEVTFKSHHGGPVYLLLQPQQRLRVAFDVPTVHRFAALGKDQVISTKRHVDLSAPQAAGVYEMVCTTHHTHWGWILVRRDPLAQANDSLRPDTRELSAAVAESLFARDAKALAKLAVPGFDAEKVIRTMRFKLTADVRYIQSSGTPNKVSTKMGVNIAEPGKPPIIARELRLQYVRVGKELKLSQATLWEVQ